MIIGEIRRYLRDNNPVRVSRSIKDVAYKAMQVKEALISKNQKEPTVDEIAKELDLPVNDVEPVSLFESAYSDSGDTVYVLDQLGDKYDDSDWLDEISFRDTVSSLCEREKKILDLRFMRGMTQMEVSQEIGISQAQVSRIEKGVIEKIKNE